LERPIYILSSALLELYILFKLDPVLDIAWEGSSSTLMFTVSWMLILSGVYMMIKAKRDMIHVPTDPLGFGFINSISKQGTEFPLAFRMKNLSTVSLMCRHPMASAMIQIMIGSLLYGPVTYGRLLVVLIHIALTLVGVNAEERMLIK
jgi:protein-S-isoprenylcysteine O-methyltransferase Ste14